MEHYYQNIQGWFTFPTFYANVVKQAKNNYHFVEVGSWKGTSTVFMGVEILNSGKTIKFDAIDTWEGSKEEDYCNPTSPQYEPLLAAKDGLYNHFLKNIEPIKDFVNPIRKTSLEAVKDYKDESINFVFIDAAHDYENVCLDIKAWLPKVKKGGVLAGHDYHHPPIRQAIDELLDNVQPILQEDVWIYRVPK